ncbi:MAG: hypothetical protein OHK0029_05780 [Armatimonadaceae bacterium]
MERKYQIQSSAKAPVQTEETKKANEISLHPVAFLAIVAACVGVSGFVSLTLTNPDQGKLVTVSEMQQRMESEIQRIQNHPHMPAQAKAYALAALQRGRFAGSFLQRQTLKVPSP